MIYALDTNTLIYYFKGVGSVVSNMLSIPPSDLAIPAVVLYELERGLATSQAPGRRRAQLAVLRQSVRLLPFDQSAAQRAGGISAELCRIGKPIGPIDALIAGTSMSVGATLVTHNTREFKRVPGLQVVDWY